MKAEHDKPIETVVSCVCRGSILTVFTTVSFSLFSFFGLTRESLNCRHGRGLAQSWVYYCNLSPDRHTAQVSSILAFMHFCIR